MPNLQVKVNGVVRLVGVESTRHYAVGDWIVYYSDAVRSRWEVGQVVANTPAATRAPLIHIRHHVKHLYVAEVVRCEYGIGIIHSWDEFRTTARKRFRTLLVTELGYDTIQRALVHDEIASQLTKLFTQQFMERAENVVQSGQ